MKNSAPTNRELLEKRLPLENRLLLASGSQARQDLLRQAAIPFDVIHHTAQEEFDPQLHLEEIVSMLAVRKMGHVQLPHAIYKSQVLQGDGPPSAHPEPVEGSSGSISNKPHIFVLTADTLVQDKFGKIQGKPKDHADAIVQIKAISGKSIISTAFCLEKKRLVSGTWQTEAQQVQAVTSDCYFEIPDNWIDAYLEHTPNFLNIAGAITIENFGAQFLKDIHGSYSAILGLPLFELRHALEKLGFFVHK